MVKRTLIKASLVVFLVGLFLVSGLTEASAGRRLTVNSPLTQLLANGFTADQVVDLLADAGISGLRKNDVYKDPMEGLSGLETFTDDQVQMLQAATAVNLFLLRLDNYSWGPGDPGDTAYLAESVQMVQLCLNEARFAEVRNQLSPTLVDFANPLTIDHLIKATNNLAETLTLWAKNGDFVDPVAECELLMDALAELALHYYVLENRGEAAIEEAITYNILPDISGTQYPQVDLGGLVTIYNQDGTVASSDIGSIPDSASVAYPAAILESVVLNGDNYILNWNLPSDAIDIPNGGYDIVIDGQDTNDTWNTTGTSQIITGLDTQVTHSFVVEARWSQADPAQFPRSNEISVSAEIITSPVPSDYYPAPILETVEIDGNSYILNWTLPSDASDFPNGGYDIIINGQDTNDTWRTTGTSQTISGLDTQVAHTFVIEARWSQADPSLFPRSNEISATAVLPEAIPDPEPTPDVEPVTYPAPVLESVEVDGGNYLLNWTLPNGATGTPDGGYDIVIDGQDTNDTWRATGTSQTISGLDTRVAHTFVLEARWTQADPSEFPRSNEVSVLADINSSSDTTDTSGSSDVSISGPLKVFPGAEGFGIDSVAGRGGRIIKVTNLNDSGSGSLRAALEASGARIVVFEVGGVIRLNSMLRISNPYVTVAGQTAPGQGIMIRDFGFSIRTHDVLLQHLAIRPGDEGPGGYDTLDGVQILSPSYNVVVDHCSISWAIDENADTWTDVHDVTFSNCIISEGLRNSLHSDGKHSKGYLAGRRNKNIAFINNLQAHNETRNPMVYGETSIVLANNVFYNAGAYSYSSIGDGWGDGPPQAAIVGNVYLSGSGTTAGYAIKIESNAPSGTAVYEANNYFDAGNIRGGQTGYFVSSSPVSLSNITIKTRESEIVNSVLTSAGARPAYRDEVDDRIANPNDGEVITGTGSWVDSVAGSGTRAPGGWPSYPQTYQTFNEGSNPHADDDGNGYTNIEEELYQMALEVE